MLTWLRHPNRLELEEGERVRVNMRPRVEEFLLRLSDEHDTYAFTAATEVRCCLSCVCM